MAWFKVCDTLSGHRKFEEVSLAAIGLWTLAGSHCAQQLTDGIVSARRAALLGGTPDLIGELVAAGLWEPVDGGYRFHDWHDYQPLREKVEASRRKTKKRVQEWRAKKDAEAETAEEDACNGVGNAVTKPFVTPLVTPLVTPPPTRPDPTRPEEPKDVPASATPKQATRKRRIPADFTLTDDMRTWAATNHPLIDVDHETETFIDHAHATGRLLVDWRRGWQMWIRKARPAQRPATRPVDTSADKIARLQARIAQRQDPA